MNKEYLQKLTKKSIKKYIDEIDKLLINKANSGSYELTYTFNKTSHEIIDSIKKYYENKCINVRYGKLFHVDYMISEHLIVDNDTNTLVFNWSEDI